MKDKKDKLDEFDKLALAWAKKWATKDYKTLEFYTKLRKFVENLIDKK